MRHALRSASTDHRRNFTARQNGRRGHLDRAARLDPTPITAMDDLRFPVGRFQRPASLSPDQRRAAIDAVAVAPAKLRDAMRGLTDAQLDTPYRPDGWTVRQVVHHVPDSHMNAFIR